MTPVLRRADERDRAFCWRLFVETMREYVEATWGWDEAAQRRMFAEWFDADAVRIVEADGEPVGVVKVDAGSVPVRLLSIQVRRPHQGRGYGSAVIRQVVREAAGKPVWLQVLKVNPARALYERLGFTVVDESATHWRMVRRPVE